MSVLQTAALGALAGGLLGAWAAWRIRRPWALLLTVPVGAMTGLIVATLIGGVL